MDLRHRRETTQVSIRAALVWSASLFLAFAAPALAGDSPPDISAQSLLARIDAGVAPTVLDVRTPEEYATSHVPGAINIPFDQVGERVSELGADRGQEIVVYCESGRRASKALATLGAKGFTGLVHLDGDMRNWREKKLPCEGSSCGKSDGS